jgi:hypothetical protein
MCTREIKALIDINSARKLTVWKLKIIRATDVYGSKANVDLYLTTHDNHKRQTSTPPTGFKLAIQVSGRPQNYALDRAAAGILSRKYCQWYF